MKNKEGRGLVVWFRPYILPILVICGAWCQAAHSSECVLQLSDATVDYGQFNRQPPGDVGSNGLISQGKRRMTLNVRCDKPGPFRFRFNGATANSAAFRFSDSGQFTVTVSQAQLDGRSVLVGAAMAGSEPTDSAGSVRLTPDRTVVVMSGVAPAIGTSLSMQVEVEVSVPSEALRVRNLTTLEGRGSLELMPR